MTAYWVAPPIQANGPGLELPPDSSSLRDRIAEAINGGPLPEPGCDWEADMYQTQAAAVIAALGLREELGSRSHGTGLMDCGVTPGPDILGRHNHRRWVTDWEKMP